MSNRIFAVAYIIVLVPSALTSQVRYSVVDDFSLNGNPNGPWSYLIGSTLAPTRASASAASASGAVQAFIGWQGTSLAGFGNEALGKIISGFTAIFPLSSTATYIIPPDHLWLSSATDNITVRFTVPVAGTYSIAGDFLSIDTGQLSHRVAILLNNAIAFSGSLATYEQSIPFTLTQTLKIGDTVDFVNSGLPTVGYGALGGLAATITPVPVPPPIYDAFKDFSLSGNPNGVWSYLTSNTPLTQTIIATDANSAIISWYVGTDVSNFDGVTQNLSGQIISSSNVALQTDHLILGSNTGNVSVRFNAPLSSTYSISGDFVGDEMGVTHSHRVSILHNGTQAFNTIITSFNQIAPFNLSLSLASGDNVDFINYADNGLYNHSTGLAATITPAPTTPPVVTSGGVVPVFSTSTTIQPGSWISIYGSDLSATTTAWNGDFPTTLGNTTVTIDGKPAYIWFVSPTQINVQAPDDAGTGTVPVVVTTPAGSFTSFVTLGAYGPSLSLLDSKHPAAIVITPGSPGNSGGGYDIIGPPGAFSFATRPVKAGETLILYGVGFGPTTPTVPAGHTFSGAATVLVLPQVTIGGVPATVTFTGIIEAGLYQLNVVVPTVSSGDQSLSATIGGMSTSGNVVVTIQ